MTSLVQAVDLPFEEAIAFFRQKANVKTERWTDVWKEAHSRAFMVAGAASEDLVEDFRQAVDRAVADGTTLEDFRKDFSNIVQKHGWVHNGSAGWRSQVIYETNLSMAYSAGRYAQMSDPDVTAHYPFWEYVHGDSVHPRPMHLAWNGTVLRCDDGWWATHYTPNGWRCSCWIRPLSHADLGRMGKDGPDTAPEVKYRTWVDKKTGVHHQVPEGIDPGFDYNPGRAWLSGIKSRPLREVSPTGDGAKGLGDFLQNPRGSIAVGNLPAQAMKVLKTAEPSVLLSDQTLEKQRRHHSDVADADYAVLAELLNKPTVVLQQGPDHIHLVRRFGRTWVGVVKATKARDENYLVSFRAANAKTLAQLLRKYPVVSGDAADLADD